MTSFEAQLDALSREWESIKDYGPTLSLDLDGSMEDDFSVDEETEKSRLLREWARERAEEKRQERQERRAMRDVDRYGLAWERARCAILPITARWQGLGR